MKFFALSVILSTSAYAADCGMWIDTIFQSNDMTARAVGTYGVTLQDVTDIRIENFSWKNNQLVVGKCDWDLNFSAKISFKLKSEAACTVSMTMGKDAYFEGRTEVRSNYKYGDPVISCKP